MGETVIEETRERLLARLEELRPHVEEAARIEAALAALKHGPRPPVTALDMLKPVPNGDGADEPD
jgi:CheY-like chemotaxis protein